MHNLAANSQAEINRPPLMSRVKFFSSPRSRHTLCAVAGLLGWDRLSRLAHPRGATAFFAWTSNGLKRRRRALCLLLWVVVLGEIEPRVNLWIN